MRNQKTQDFINEILRVQPRWFVAYDPTHGFVHIDPQTPIGPSVLFSTIDLDNVTTTLNGDPVESGDDIDLFVDMLDKHGVVGTEPLRHLVAAWVEFIETYLLRVDVANLDPTP